MAANFPVWPILSREAQNAYLIAERMLQTGESLGTASWNLFGHSWDAQRLASGLARVSQAMTETGTTSANVEAVIAHGTQVAAQAQTAAQIAGGGGIVTRVLSSLGRWILRKLGLSVGESVMAATLTGAVATTLVLGLLTWALASYLGSQSGDQSVQPGSRFASPPSTPVQAPASTGAGPYFIFSLNLSGPNIYVGSKSDLQRPSCQFTDGGLCHDGDPDVQVLATIGGPYDTYDQAVAAYCQKVTNIHSAWGGTKGYINGVDYWLDNAPACSS